MAIITKEQLLPILLQKGYIKPQMTQPTREKILNYWWALLSQVEDKNPPLNTKLASRMILGKVLRRNPNVSA